MHYNCLSEYFAANRYFVKSLRILSFSGPYSVQVRKNKDQKNLIRTLFTQLVLCESRIQFKIPHHNLIKAYSSYSSILLRFYKLKYLLPTFTEHLFSVTRASFKRNPENQVDALMLLYLVELVMKDCHSIIYHMKEY